MVWVLRDPSGFVFTRFKERKQGMTRCSIRSLVASATALVAAFAMGATGAVAANAAEQTADLKIHNAAGRTFTALKVGDYTQVLPPAQEGAEGSVSVETVANPAQVKESSTKALSAMFGTDPVPDGVTTDPIAYVATNWGVGSDGATTPTDAGKPQYDGKVRLFLNNLWKDKDFRNLFDSDSAITKTAAEGADTVEFTGIPQGEYVLVDKTAHTADNGVTLPMFVSTTATTAGGTRVDVKGMTEDIDAKGEAPGTPQKTTDKADYNVGDTVRFTIKATVPTYLGYDAGTYDLKMNDTLTKGLTFDAAKANVTVSLNKLGTDQVLATIPAGTPGYALTTDSDMSNGGKIVFDLSSFFRDLITKGDGHYAGAQIVISYDTTLNANAIDTTPGDVHNSASLEYSNDPNASISGEPATPGKTPEGKAKVYTYNFDLTKINKATNEKLAGAKFSISKGGADLKFVKLDDGSYRKAMATDAPASTVTTVVTGAQGNLSIKGVASGDDYQVKETEAPNGFMTLKDLSFGVKILPTYGPDDSGEQELKTLEYGFVADPYGLAQMTSPTKGSYQLMNVKSLAQLPLTGAAGIMFLVVVGGLMVAAGVCIYLASMRSKRDASSAVHA